VKSPHPAPWVIVVTLVPIALVVVGVALFWPRAAPPLERADLEADPAFALQMPGADELAHVGGDRRFEFGGAFEQQPFAGHIYGATATSADVYSYYESELERLGWLKQSPPYPRSSAELENRLYCKTGLGFRLAIKNKDTAFQAAFYRGREYTTVFDARLHPNDPKSPCPLPPRPPRLTPGLTTRP
jgi:hypothetical protein